MSIMSVPVRRLPHGADLPLPAQATAGSAGLDLVAAVPQDAPVRLAPGTWAAIPTGLALALPEGLEAQVRPRSGLALKSGVTVLNAPGTVDADYRGEVLVLLINHGREPFEVTRGLRVAQMVVAPVLHIKLEEIGELGETARGAGGFGSTGMHSARETR